MSTVIIALIVALLIFLVGRKLYKDKKSGKSCCGGNCASCGCCGADGNEVKKISEHADFSEYKYRYSVKTGGMTCKNCALRIENAFNRQGDIYAKVDYKTGLSEVLSKAPLSEFVLRNTIIGLGYTVDEIRIIEP